MKKIIQTVILLFLCQGLVLSQYINPIEYFPLNVGNVWVYNCVASGYGYCNCIKRIRIKTTTSRTINGKTYFISQKTESIISPFCGGGGCGIISFDTLRVDSINYNIYKYSYQGCTYSPAETMIDSLNAGFHDTIKTDCGNYYFIFTDTSSQNIFGMLLPSKLHSNGDFEFFSGRRYIKGIGLSGFGCSYPMCTDNSLLIGCVINGIVYGDTTFPVGVTKIGTEIPGDFSLSQNYPNPFNPITKIKFQAPLSPPERGMQDVSLRIYDVLGREVAIIFSSPWGRIGGATYEAEWDGTNYPSGLYFYSLTAGDYSETRKMVLIK